MNHLQLGSESYPSRRSRASILQPEHSPNSVHGPAMQTSNSRVTLEEPRVAKQPEALWSSIPGLSAARDTAVARFTAGKASELPPSQTQAPAWRGSIAGNSARQSASQNSSSASPGDVLPHVRNPLNVYLPCSCNALKCFGWQVRLAGGQQPMPGNNEALQRGALLLPSAQSWKISCWK